MMKVIKDYIKTKPKLYDALNEIRPAKSKVELWLTQFTKANQGKLNFIQIGANDGLRWDPFRKVIIKGNWDGIIVEPLPQVFAMLMNNYAYLKHQKLIFVNAAISDKNEEYIDIWSVSDAFLSTLSMEDKLYYLRLSSLDKNHVEAHLKNFNSIEDKMQCFRVKCITLDALIEKYGFQRTDLIFIDAEGHDDKIIRSIDFEKIQPKAIIFESHNLGERKQQLHDFIHEKGYKIIDVDGDSIAYK